MMCLSALNMQSDWFFLVVVTFSQMILCRQKPTRKPCCDRETTCMVLL